MKQCEQNGIEYEKPVNLEYRDLQFDSLKIKEEDVTYDECLVKDMLEEMKIEHMLRELKQEELDIPFDSEESHGNYTNIIEKAPLTEINEGLKTSPERSISDTSQPVEKEYKCDVCPRQFSHTRTLSVHKRIHTGKGVVFCKQCGKKFTRSDHLKEHSKVHTNEKPYVCTECNRGFKNNKYLKDHIRSQHTGETPYVCSFCNKRFSAYSNLYRHRFIHAKVKPHVCNVCNEDFAELEKLKLHIRSKHTGEKPHVCTVCDKRFVSSCILYRHKFTHSKEKPHVCHVCGKGFSVLVNLKVHHIIHMDKKLNGIHQTKLKI